MPHMHVNGVNLYYEDTGGDHAETIFFSHGLLFCADMYEKQIAAFKDRYRCISYDHRGQSRSEVTEGGYDMDTLSADALELMKALDTGPCHFVGLSMGGFVGMRLAIRHPEMLKSLTLLETSADLEPPGNLPRYNLMLFIARWFGLRPVGRGAMKSLFGTTFLRDRSRKAEYQRWIKHVTSHDRTGIIKAVRAVFSREGVYEQIDQIKMPTLIMVGEEDIATVPEKSHRMHERIPGSELVILPKAGHSSTIENPEAVINEMRRFLDSL